MKNKSCRTLSTLLAMVMVFSLFAVMPLTASAAEPLKVTENPVGATYNLGDTAVPLKATFSWPNAYDGSISSSDPIKLQWYWTLDPLVMNEQNGAGETTIPYSRPLEINTEHTPDTDTVGVKYYYAVVSYTAVSLAGSNYQDRARTNPARVEVVDDTQEFTALKLDDKGAPLAGATIRAVSKDGSVDVEVVTDANGIAKFSVPVNSYTVSESKAPQGYNGTDLEYYVNAMYEGVVTVENPSDLPDYPILFVNKPIPQLEKDDHFAFAQGYPEGDFRPERNMPRAEAVVLFHNLLVEGLQVPGEYDVSLYPDIKPTEWYANHVGHMLDLGVLDAYTRGENFRPQDPVTRAEFATLAAHFADLELSDVNIFPDVPNDHWAVKYINSSVEKGWIGGYPDGTFRPDAFITRAEVMTLVGTVLDRKADSAFLAANASSIPVNFPDVGGHWAYLAIMEATIAHDYKREGGVEIWTAFR